MLPNTGRARQWFATVALQLQYLNRGQVVNGTAHIYVVVDTADRGIGSPEVIRIEVLALVLCARSGRDAAVSIPADTVQTTSISRAAPGSRG